MRSSIVAVLLSFSLLTLTASADSKDVLDRWNGWMAESASHLKSGDHKAALKLADRTIREMIDQLGPGDASTELFGTVLTYKALAHAGLGEEEEAVWYWQTVVSLYPKVAEANLSMFGEPGEFLKSNITPEPLPAPEGEFVAPVLRKRVKPKFPHGAHYFGVSGELVVQVVVTPDGRVQAPAIVQPLPAPTLSYVALEALRRWRFDPAKAGGTPVPFTFTLTINYKD
jgi:TonB family protein